MNRDGYVIGSELGLYLHQRIANLTQNRQTPRSGKLNAYGYDLGDFVFRTSPTKTHANKPKPVPSMELAFWQSVKEQGIQQAYEAYVRKFPKGNFTPLAQMKLKEYARLEESEAKQKAELNAARNKLATAETKRRKLEAAKRRKELQDLQLQQKQERQLMERQRNDFSKRLKAMEESVKKREKIKSANFAKRLKELAEATNRREEARSADRASAQKSDGKITIAGLSDPTETPASPLSRRELAIAAQKHLDRVGCYSGRIDGNWGPQSRTAISYF